MHIKIQGGGGGTYANTGSCSSVANYLEHEDSKNKTQGKEIEPFFNHRQESVKSLDVINSIDKNKAKLCQDESKFFVITVSPSSEELKKMGNTPAEQSEAFKNYIKNDFAKQYAENFNKELTKDDLMYYAKIHTERNGKNENDMHVHIIVSRKTANNKVKISPQTNHKGTTKGTVKGGFDRKEFINKMEQSFDQKFNYQRNIEESFEYKNAMKNGTFAQRKEQIFKAAAQEKKSNLVQDKKEILEQKNIEENIKQKRQRFER
ncbi:MULTISPECIES: DUF5712 family protein [unclassified Flavobacterium]|uniref:DUF5712 family protein n=1 Tax=unclassified Flavobacterium TaxID=196869 RepID=UPI00131BD6CA|nr:MULTISPECIES: DUF5712 family protein [unclassified Flavobacterium]